MKRIDLENVCFSYSINKYGGNSLKQEFISCFSNKKNYKGKECFDVLKNITFSLESGDRLCIIGRNGAGKTTLLRLLANIYQPVSGSLKINGNISCMIEIGAGMNPELTGRENIYFMAMLAGFSKKHIKNMEDEIIDFADVREFIDVQVKYYSTGMAGRLAFATSTSIHPDILIADELFAGGDVNFVAKATSRLEDMKNRADVFVAVSHNLEQVKSSFNKILYLKDRKVSYFGSDIDGAIKQYYEDSGVV